MKQTIMQRLGCTESDAEMVLREVQQLHSSLKDAWDQWIRDEKIDETVCAEGYTISQLMETYDIPFTGAILTLDWLLKEPEQAKQALTHGIR